MVQRLSADLINISGLPLGSILFGLNIATLRTTEPDKEGDVVILKEHTAGTGLGGGEFRAVLGTSPGADNNGTIIRTTGGNTWVRILDGQVNPLMFGAKANGTDDSAALTDALAANMYCDGLGLTYSLASTVSMNKRGNQLYNARLRCIGANPLVRMREPEQVIDNVFFDGNSKQLAAGVIWEGARTGNGGKILNCTFDSLGYSGISVSGDYTNRVFANGGRITNCTFNECGHMGTTNNRCSILADGVNNFQIKDIIVRKANWGIYVRMDTGLADKARAVNNIVSDCWIQGSGRTHATFTDAQGLSANRQENMKVHNMIISDFADNAFDFGSGRGCHITNFHATACKDAIFIGDISCDRYVIDNVQAQSCDRGLRIVMDGTIYPTETLANIHIVNMSVFDPVFAGFYVGNTGATTVCRNISLVNCNVDSTNSWNGASYQYPYYIRGIQYLDMINCNSASAKAGAVKMDNACDFVSLRGGRHLDCNRSATAGVFAIDSAANNNRVEITDTSVYGGGANTGAIRTGSGSTGCKVHDNRCRGISAATLYDLSTSVNCYAANNTSY